MSIESLNRDLTVMHISNASMKSDASMRSDGAYSSQQMKEQTDEEIKQYAGEDPVIKGNKQLSVEVKLSDLVRYGALG